MSRFEFLGAAPPGATVTIDATIRTTEELLATLSAALDFEPGVPAWGALVDRLSDASYQAGTEAFIDHASLPDLPDADLRLYVGHLSDAFAPLSIECAGLRVSFRGSDASRVHALLDARGGVRGFHDALVNAFTRTGDDAHIEIDHATVTMRSRSPRACTGVAFSTFAESKR